MRIQLLGRVDVDDTPLTTRQRCLLTALLLEPGRAVPMSRLLDAVWGDDQPSTPANALRTQIHRLRRTLADVPDIVLTTVGNGYSLEIDPGLVDLHRFRRLVAEARTTDDPVLATQLLRSGLSLWHGPPLEGLPSTPLWDGLRAALDAERTAARHELKQAETQPLEPTQVPHQLPGAIPDFTGRGKELNQLAESAETVLITAIDGTAGVGKTALALHFSHSVPDRFPDGQLYVNLRGFDPHDRPLRPGDVLTQFLRALGIKPERVPISVDEQSALYRTLLSGRRMLVLLDNAVDADQVRPLLPGNESCLVLITSRNRLAELDALPLFLDVLDPDEAVELLRELLGDDLVDAEPAAAAELAALCGYLPLALRIAAANTAPSPTPSLRPAPTGMSISNVVADLREENRLAALAIADDEQVAVRAAFDLSYKALTPAQRRLFRRLGLVPGLDFTAESATRLAGEPADPDQLVRANLLEEHASGRYRFHDLLRLYAYDRAQSDDTAEQRRAACDRLYEWYLDTTHQAAQFVGAEFCHLGPGKPEESRFSSSADAVAWLESERANLVAVSAYSPNRVKWLLADRLHGFFKLRRHGADWLAVAEAALAGAGTDEAGRLTALHNLSNAHWSRGQHQRAIEYAQAALAIAWPEARARILNSTGHVYREIGDIDTALDCYTEAIELNRAQGFLDVLPSNYFGLGATCWQQGRLEEARYFHGEALRLARESDSAYFAGFYLGVVGGPLRDLGDVDTAIEYMTESVRVLKEHGARSHASYMLDDLSWAYRDAGRYDEALRIGREALDMALDIGDPGAETDARNTIASVQELMGDLDEAQEHHARALVLARRTGYRHGEAVALIGLTSTTADVTHALQSLSISRMAGYKLLEAQALTVLAEVHLRRGEDGQAHRYAHEALALHEASGHHVGLRRTREVLSQVTGR
ncbi:ATP-binding protein [Lentzea tibetensis]|uniref:ATP-binding protein n=1 Tax=Lentzea tibetensis TaxID=2591470 RepID=UPI00164618B6|nr:tetratricopeptide repeat protein [Lentzea tibetensis]